MASPSNRNVGRRGSTMAIACGIAIASALTGMYLLGKDVKEKEGKSFPYSNRGQGLGGGDKAMTSSDVNAVVSIPKPGSDRTGTAAQKAEQK